MNTIVTFVKCPECPHYRNIPNDADLCMMKQDYKHIPELESVPTWCPMRDAKCCSIQDTVWKPISSVPNDKWVLIKGSSGVMRTREYIIKAEYNTDYNRWLTVQNDAVSDEFTSPPTYWMEVPK